MVRIRIKKNQSVLCVECFYSLFLLGPTCSNSRDGHTVQTVHNIGHKPIEANRYVLGLGFERLQQRHTVQTVHNIALEMMGPSNSLVVRIRIKKSVCTVCRMFLFPFLLGPTCSNSWDEHTVQTVHNIGQQFCYVL